MEPISEPERLNADTWDWCDDLMVFGRFLIDYDLRPDPPPTERRYRLFVAAYLRAMWGHLDPLTRALVDQIECQADAEPFEADALSGSEVRTRLEEHLNGPGVAGWAASAGWVAWYASDSGTLAEDMNDLGPLWVQFANDLSRDPPPGATVDDLGLFHDLFPNPFRPDPFDPVWRTSTVTALAGAIYAARAWDRMPVLADALEDAGCTDARVLNHCRRPGPHARGCWVVDAILGKT